MKNERVKKCNNKISAAAATEQIPNIKNHLASEDKVYGVKNSELLERAERYEKVV